MPELPVNIEAGSSFHEAVFKLSVKKENGFKAIDCDDIITDGFKNRRILFIFQFHFLDLRLKTLVSFNESFFNRPPVIPTVKKLYTPVKRNVVFEFFHSGKDRSKRAGVSVKEKDKKKVTGKSKRDNPQEENPVKIFHTPLKSREGDSFLQK